MKVNRVAAAVAVVAIASGFGITLHDAAAGTHPAALVTTAHPATAHLLAAPAAAPAVTWLESAGGQAQVRFNDAVDALTVTLEIESHSDTLANHLAFEADARTVRTQARTILATPALLPTVGRAAYKVMLNDFITVANLLQPGPGYGTTPQDDTAWQTAMTASDITVS
jgi:hypothetical protein